jgi:hypothetical protein
MLTLPSGKKITAGEYYRQLNELEQRLNQTGHSLREHTRKLLPAGAPKPVRRMKAGPQSAIPLAAEATRVRAMLTPQGVLQTQKLQAANKTRRAPSAARLIALPTSQVFTKTTGTLALGTGPSAIAVCPRTCYTERYKTSQYWGGWTEGDPSTFFINVGGGRLDLEGVRRGDTYPNPGDVTTANIHAEAEIAGSVFGQPYEMLRVAADGHAPQSQPADVRLGLYVFGSQVYEWSPPNGIGIQSDPSNPPGYQNNFGPPPVTIPILQVGPISVAAHAGVNLQAGVTLNYGLFPTNAFAHVQPYVNTGGYVSVDAGLGVGGYDIASVGVRGNITFLDDGVDFRGSVGLYLDPDANNNPYFDIVYSGTETWHVLDGSIYLYATADLPVGVCQLLSDNCDCSFPYVICSAEWDLPIISWGGDSGTAPIFGGEEKIPL